MEPITIGVFAGVTYWVLTNPLMWLVRRVRCMLSNRRLGHKATFWNPMGLWRMIFSTAEQQLLERYCKLEFSYDFGLFKVRVTEADGTLIYETAGYSFGDVRKKLGRFVRNEGEPGAVRTAS